MLAGSLAGEDFPMRGRYGNFTPRQRQIVLLAAEGLSNKEIARRLDISEGTVKAHLHNIFERLGLENRTSLAALIHKTNGAE